MVTKRPKGLGRGLEALLGPTFDENATNTANAAAANSGAPSSLMLTEMVAGQYQPRTRMDEGALYSWPSPSKPKASCNRSWCAA